MPWAFRPSEDNIQIKTGKYHTATFYVKRSFKNFDDYWNIYSVGPSVSGTLKSLSSETVNEIKLKLNTSLERDADNNIITYAFANAVKGIKTEGS